MTRKKGQDVLSSAHGTVNTERELGSTQHRDTASHTPGPSPALDVFFLEVPVGKVAHPTQGAHQEGCPKEGRRLPLNQSECIGDNSREQCGVDVAQDFPEGEASLDPLKERLKVGPTAVLPVFLGQSQELEAVQGSSQEDVRQGEGTATEPQLTFLPWKGRGHLALKPWL